MSEQETERRALIPYPASSPARVQVANRQLAIAAYLKQDIERGRLVAILKRISSDDAASFLSTRQGLDSDLIGRFADRWTWSLLQANTALPWSLELIDRFVGRWDWGSIFHGGLADDTTLPWSIELVNRFTDRWNWESLSGNEYLPWSIELIERFADRWDWGGRMDGGRYAKGREGK